MKLCGLRNRLTSDRCIHFSRSIDYMSATEPDTACYYRSFNQVHLSTSYMYMICMCYAINQAHPILLHSPSPSTTKVTGDFLLHHSLHTQSHAQIFPFYSAAFEYLACTRPFCSAENAHGRKIATYPTPCYPPPQLFRKSRWRGVPCSQPPSK